MDNGDLDGSGEDEFRGPRGRKYRPVLNNDRAVLEMSSMGPGSSSSSYPNQPASLNAGLTELRDGVELRVVGSEERVMDGMEGGSFFSRQ